jgi:GntR family transcriptional repressor for pyruvate dehydrogenase complex
VSEDAAFTFDRVRRVRSFDDVTLQIREAIRTEAIPVGSRLPSERDLCEMFGVSRPTLREALRSLEALGVVEIRQGSKGGAFARAPSEDLLGHALSTLLSFQGATQEELMEFRLSFEGENAELAAQRVSPEELVTLAGLVEEVDRLARAAADAEALHEVDERWHEAIARAAGNSVRLGIMLGVQDAMRRALPLIRSRLVSEPASLREDMERLLGALRAGDAAAARVVMEAHVRRWSEPKVDGSRKR